MSMIYITLILAIFATTNARLIGNDPKTWSPTIIDENIVDNTVISSNVLLGNNTSTWSPTSTTSTTKWEPIITHYSIIIDDDYTSAKLTMNRNSDDETLPKIIYDIIDWFKFNKTRINYSNRRLFL